MKRFIALALSFCAVLFPGVASAIDYTVGVPFSCQPSGGKSTCMQDVLLADDVTIALLAGATPDQAASVGAWVLSPDRKKDFGFSRHAQRVTTISYKSISTVANPAALQLRLKEIESTDSFLVPFGSILTSVREKSFGNVGRAFAFSATNEQSRVRYSAGSVDICATHSSGRYCIRLPAMSGGKKLPDLWSMYLLPEASVQGFMPKVLSPDWSKNTLVAVEVQISDRVVKAENGERIVHALPKRLVMFNHGYLIGQTFQ